MKWPLVQQIERARKAALDCSPPDNDAPLQVCVNNPVNHEVTNSTACIDGYIQGSLTGPIFEKEGNWNPEFSNNTCEIYLSSIKERTLSNVVCSLIAAKYNAILF